MIGLPGERCGSAGGGLEVDGAAVPEPYLAGPATAPVPSMSSWARPSTWSFGDHRAASTDGRDFGPVGADALVGRVRFAYWPPRRLRRRG